MFVHLLFYMRVYSKLSEYGVQRGSDGSVSVSDSVLVKVSGADEDVEKEVLVSWSLQVRNCNKNVFCFCELFLFLYKCNNIYNGSNNISRYMAIITGKPG